MLARLRASAFTSSPAERLPLSRDAPAPSPALRERVGVRALLALLFCFVSEKQQKLPPACSARVHFF